MSADAVHVRVILPYTVGDAALDEVATLALLLASAVLLATWTLSTNVNSGVDVDKVLSNEDDDDQEVVMGVCVTDGEGPLRGGPLYGACTCPSMISEAV